MKHIEVATTKRIVLASDAEYNAVKKKLEALKKEFAPVDKEYQALLVKFKAKDYGPNYKKNEEAYANWKKLKAKRDSLSPSHPDYDKIVDQTQEAFDSMSTYSTKGSKEQEAFLKVWRAVSDNHENLEDEIQSLESKFRLLESSKRMHEFLKEEEKKRAKKGKKK